MNKSLIGAILVLLVGAVVGLIVITGGDNEPAATNTTTQQAAEATDNTDTDSVDADAQEPEDIEQISAATVAMHAEESDCWTIINSNVYDITSYIPRHPGGDEILRACGTDGTSLFLSRTTNDGETVGSGTAHSGNATSQLQSLFLGQLAQ